MKHFLIRSLGVLLPCALAVPAWELGKLVPLIGAPVFAILIGMALSFFMRPAFLEEGIRFSARTLLQYSIVFLGFSLDLRVVLRVGGQSLAVMLFTLSAAFITAYLVGKVLRLDANLKILIGVGTSICGGSAIAAAAPVIGADDRDVTYSISTIFLFNIVAVFLFPALGHLMRMSADQFGLWAGTAINDTSSVVAAAFSYGDAAGPLRHCRQAHPHPDDHTDHPGSCARTGPGCPGPQRSAPGNERDAQGARLEMAKIIPWFVLGFLAASLVRSLGVLPDTAASALSEIGKFGICIAMAAIGLNANPLKLVRNGVRPILLGLACWAAVAVVSLLVQRTAL